MLQTTSVSRLCALPAAAVHAPQQGRHSCRCFRDGQYEQAVGIALEARQLDKLEETIRASPDTVQTLTYALKVSQTLVINREFRQQVGVSLWGSCISARSQPRAEQQLQGQAASCALLLHSQQAALKFSQTLVISQDTASRS